MELEIGKPNPISVWTEILFDRILPSFPAAVDAAKLWLAWLPPGLSQA
jgi:hypothetical protein